MVGALVNRGTTLRVQRYLNQATSSVSNRFARLSSGSRVNSASDDAAGIAIADKLRANSKTLAVASRNVSDGLSALAIVGSALEQQSSILTRMSELAAQAANGSFSSTQRESVSREYLTLMREYKRIAESTEFNDQRMLLGLRPRELSALAIQAGISGSADSLVRHVNPDTGEYSGYVDLDTMEYVSDGGADWGDFLGSSHSLEDILARFPNLSFQSRNGVETDTSTDILVFFGIETSLSSQGGLGVATFSLDGETGLYSATSSGVIVPLSAGDPSRLDPTFLDAISIDYGVELSALRFASSSGTGIQASVLELSGVESAARAQNALDVLTTKLSSLSLDRSNVGAAESRLGTAIGVLAASVENTLSAESRIRDVDVASEVAELTRERILQESSVSALRLVNETQAIILDLLVF